MPRFVDPEANLEARELMVKELRRYLVGPREEGEEIQGRVFDYYHTGFLCPNGTLVDEEEHDQEEPGDDKDIRLLTGPNLTGTLLAESNVPGGADFVVGDFNHNTSGVYYPWVSGGGQTPFSTQWASGNDILSVGVPVNGAAGGSPCDFIRIWDVRLDAGQDYRLTLTSGGPAEVRVWA